MSATRISVVTGGNKGIGFEIVRELCSKFTGIVYLTARDKDRGLAACERLVMEGCKTPPKFLQLDIASEESVERFRDHINETYQGLDVLVNNAAIAYKKQSAVPSAEQAENTIKVNVLGTLNVCKYLFPLLRPHARVVHVSSLMGKLHRITSESFFLKIELTRPDITESELVSLIQQFVYASETDDHGSKRGPTRSYAISKLALNILTTIQARDRPYDKDTDVLINSCCPGWCRTDMGGPNATKTAVQGAETPVFLALIPPGSEQPHGKFYSELKEASWK